MTRTGETRGNFRRDGVGNAKITDTGEATMTLP